MGGYVPPWTKYDKAGKADQHHAANTTSWSQSTVDVQLTLFVGVYLILEIGMLTPEIQRFGEHGGHGCGD
jgi:hypothetical protein